MPRTLATLMVKSPGSLAPGRAQGTLRPASDVRRAADDLLRFAAADIDTADIQPIGVGVLVDFEHVGHDNLVEGGRDALLLFDFEAGHGQQVRKLLARKARVRRSCAARIQRIS